MLSVKWLIRTIGRINRIKGIYHKKWTPGEYLMQIVSETAEVYEELRKGCNPSEIYFDDTGKPQGPAIELADVLLCICGFAKYFGIDLEKAIRIKLEYERHRPYKHGKEF